VEDFNQPAILAEAVVNAYRRVEELADARPIRHRHTEAWKVLQQLDMVEKSYSEAFCRGGFSARM
jgi:hypothetical protein